ncbi:MAG: hypothetical protein WAN65_00420 [Candidatus Sulfotelmatobacter sp.]
MIPNDNEFDVFVVEGVLVEVWHGERISAAQQFGVDWDGPVHSVMHAAVFASRADDAPPAPLPWDVRAVAVLESRGFRYLLLLAALCSLCLVARWHGLW